MLLLHCYESISAPCCWRPRCRSLEEAACRAAAVCKRRSVTGQLFAGGACWIKMWVEAQGETVLQNLLVLGQSRSLETVVDYLWRLWVEVPGVGGQCHWLEVEAEFKSHSG